MLQLWEREHGLCREPRYGQHCDTLPGTALTLWVPAPLQATCLLGKNWGCWLSWLQGMVLCSQLECAEGARMHSCCGVCFSEQCPELGQPWSAHRHRASAERAGVNLKVHHKPASSTETLALLCLPCHPALSCMFLQPSALLSPPPHPVPAFHPLGHPRSVSGLPYTMHWFITTP